MSSSEEQKDKAAAAAPAKGPAPDPEDEDLTKLLDSALGDFGKAAAKPEDAQAGSSGGEGGEGSGEGGEGFVMNQQMAQQAAAEFQNMLKQLAEVQKKVLEKGMAETEAARKANPEQTPALGPIAAAAAAAGLTDAAGGSGGGAGGAAAPGGEGPVSPEEEAAFATSLINNLQGLAEKAQKVTEAEGEEEFMKAMSDMHNNEAYTQEFLPFMQGLMGSLLSKDMMYPSLKEMTEKYPKWLEDNKDTISKEDKERYEVQLGLMEEAVKEYDAEKEDDSEEVVGQRMEKLIMIMQRMQMCGHPPEALVGELPSGWAMSPEGLPQVTDQNAAAENCCVM